MKRLICFIMFTAFLTPLIHPQEKRATPADAEAWTKKAIAFYKEAGKDKAFAEFNNPAGKFTQGDLYMLVYGPDGKCYAQGSDSTAVGKIRLDIVDIDGKFIIKERLEIAQTKGAGWQKYKWPNPVTKKIEDKTVYIEKVDDFIFACGAYLNNK